MREDSKGTRPIPYYLSRLNNPGWILVFITALAILLAPFPKPVSASEHLFHIEAGRFEYSPSVLQVSPGDRVTLELVSTDVVHGLSIDGYGLSMTADPGKTERLTFTAEKAGVFRFRCTASCGNMHPFMTGKLYVGSNETFWRLGALAVLSVLTILWKGRERRWTS